MYAMPVRREVQSPSRLSGRSTATVPAVPSAEEKIILHYAATFAIIGAFMPFWPLWLESRGLSSAQIGTIMAAGIFVRVLSPFLAQRIDESEARRGHIALLLLATCTAVFAIYPLADGFAATLVVHIAFGLGFMVIFPLTDSVAVGVAGARYGRLRLWGSASFMLTAIATGQLVDRTSIDAAYGVILSALVASTLASLFLPEPQRAPLPLTESDADAAQRPLRAVLRHRGFVLFVAGAGVVQSSHAGVYSFGALHWEGAGISESTIGLLWGVGVVAEILLFAFGAHLARRVGARRLALFGGSCATLRWCVLASTTQVPWLFAAQTLHFASFGATHLAVITFIAATLPPRLAVTGQAIYGAVGMGLCMGAGTIGAGWLFDEIGGTMFFTMAGVAAVGTSLLLVQARRAAPVRDPLLHDAT